MTGWRSASMTSLVVSGIVLRIVPVDTDIIGLVLVAEDVERCVGVCGRSVAAWLVGGRVGAVIAVFSCVDAQRSLGRRRGGPRGTRRARRPVAFLNAIGTVPP